jgi:hypothetical protein
VGERRGHRRLADTALAGDDHEPLCGEGQVAGHDARDSRPLRPSVNATWPARPPVVYVSSVHASSALRLRAGHPPRFARTGAAWHARCVSPVGAGPIATADPTTECATSSSPPTYDGTLARDGRVDAPTIAALEAVRRSGPQDRAGDGPAAGGPGDRVSAARSLRVRRRRERRAVITVPRRTRRGRSPSAARAIRRARSAARGGSPLGRRPRHRRDVASFEDVVLDAIRVLRARAAGRLQQGRRHGAARGHQQGGRPRRGRSPR